jgi:multimeric flavodoxin WrbA
MYENLSRRRFMGAAGATVAAGAMGGAAAARQAAGIKIVGIACSLRKGKTTVAAIKACLEAAKAVAPDRVETECVDLAELSIPAGPAAGIPLAEGQADDFPALAEKLTDPKVAGIVIGSPVYMGTMSSLCKAFRERCVLFRKNNFALSGKVAGSLAVGGARNGGQERTVQDILAGMVCHEMVVVGESRPTCHAGGTLWNKWKDDISKDEAGMATAKNLGKQMAQVALKMAGAKK